MKNEYYELSLKVPKQYYSLFCDFVLDLGVDAIEEKDDWIIVRDENSLNDLLWGIQTFKDKLSKKQNHQINILSKIEKKKSQDWIDIFKKSIKPVKVGKFYIHPTWDKNEKEYINILIDPALSFGTGHHETTSSCLEIINEIVKKDDSFLDVGCGSGILSIAANKLGANVELCDTDPMSIESAKKNFILNHAKYDDIWVGSAGEKSKKYDIVVANIVADILIMISNNLKHCVKNNGNLILSGILDKYLDNVLAKFSDFQTIKTIQKKEWVTLYLKKG